MPSRGGEKLQSHETWKILEELLKMLLRRSLMDIFSVLSNRLRTLQLETPRLTDSGRQIIQEDNPSTR